VAIHNNNPERLDIAAWARFFTQITLNTPLSRMTVWVLRVWGDLDSVDEKAKGLGLIGLLGLYKLYGLLGLLGLLGSLGAGLLSY
jgi:hypothetical protein